MAFDHGNDVKKHEADPVSLAEKFRTSCIDKQVKEKLQQTHAIEKKIKETIEQGVKGNIENPPPIHITFTDSASNKSSGGKDLSAHFPVSITEDTAKTATCMEKTAQNSIKFEKSLQKAHFGIGIISFIFACSLAGAAVSNHRKIKQEQQNKPPAP